MVLNPLLPSLAAPFANPTMTLSRHLTIESGCLILVGSGLCAKTLILYGGVAVGKVCPAAGPAANNPSTPALPISKLARKFFVKRPSNSASSLQPRAGGQTRGLQC